MPYVKWRRMGRQTGSLERLLHSRMQSLLNPSLSNKFYALECKFKCFF